MPASWTSQPRFRSRSAIASATFRLCCVYVKYTNRTRVPVATMRLCPARGGACRGAVGGGDQGPDDPQDGDEESDPEHQVVALAECRQAEVDPARHVQDAQQNPEKRHVGPFEFAPGS